VPHVSSALPGAQRCPTPTVVADDVCVPRERHIDTLRRSGRRSSTLGQTQVSTILVVAETPRSIAGLESNFGFTVAEQVVLDRDRHRIHP
jgi:hypothetical protein